MICKKCRSNIDDDSIYCKFCGTQQIRKRFTTKRHSNGFGCVEKLSGNRSKPYAVKISEMVDGKQKRHYIGYYATEKEAYTALLEQQAAPVTPLTRITFEMLFKKWCSTRAYKDLSQATKYNYDAAFKHFSNLHSRVFSELKTADFEGCIHNAAKVVKNELIPLSASGKRHMKILAGLLTKYALENDIIRKGYSEYIRLEKAEKNEHQIFTSEEITTLFKHDDVNGVDIILILIYTGLRINELLNLTKESINFENNTITGGLKTDAGRNRVIPIHSKIIEYIKKYYDNSTDYLFTRNETSQRLTDRYFREKLYRPALAALSIPEKPIHSTRHTFATMLTQNQADTEAIKTLLGHSSYAFTADTYTHVNINYLQNAINSI